MSEEYDTECVQCCGYQDRIAELEGALNKYGGHTSSCAIFYIWSHVVSPCNCGWAALENKDE